MQTTTGPCLWADILPLKVRWSRCALLHHAELDTMCEHSRRKATGQNLRCESLKA